MASIDLNVLPVTTAALHREFCELPYRLYRSDPLWVAPLRSVEYRRWSPEHNASLRWRWCRRFVIRRKDRVVGRIAAVIDEEFSRRWLPGAGFLGFFECAEDDEAAQALLAAAEDALRHENRTCLLGPINLTTQDEVGLLVDGDGTPPMILSPYNPPYYERLLSAFGFTPRCEYHAYRCSPDCPQAPAIGRLLRWHSGSGLAIRPSDRNRWAAETRLLFDLYNASFAQTWGFVPLSWEEFDERARTFRSFYDPEFVLFAQRQGRPVGFALVLPDINEALARAAGWPWPLVWLRLALAVRRIRQVRFILLGVLPEATGVGVAALLAHEAVSVARRRGIRTAELSLVHGDNHRVTHVIEAFAGQKCKTYRLFEKLIAAPSPGRR
jgi:GNAT superfamily N-acetyltransferase